MVHKTEVIVPFSVLKAALAKILLAEGYLISVEKVGKDAIPPSPRLSKRANRRGRSDILRLVLKYDAVGRPALTGIDRVSKPSRRVYVQKGEVPMVRSGLGVAIVSTPSGLMTSRQARTAGIGGELICRIY
jgi:small subunit ribosomal protein S8